MNLVEFPVVTYDVGQGYSFLVVPVVTYDVGHGYSFLVVPVVTYDVGHGYSFLVVPVVTYDVGHGYSLLRVFFPLLTSIPLRSPSSVSNSFYLLLLFFILHPQLNNCS